MRSSSGSTSRVTSVDRARIGRLREREEERFVREHPRSRELFERGRASLIGGVPMNWMRRWPGSFPPFIAEAGGARLTDVDGLEYVDLCLGDTGAMAGHAPPAAVEAIAERTRRGVTFMLPTDDAFHVGEQMARRFGVPRWQFSLTATDANRFVIRLARHVTRRPKILVFNYCYHGSVDETVATLDGGAVVARPGNTGPPVDPAVTTRMVEFNDLPALEAELAHGDVACVLAEPALTNIGIVHPEPGYHEALRALTRAAGTLLVIDETHTICAGPGGYTAAHGLEPDVVTIGKAIASGVPIGAYGVTDDVAERAAAALEDDATDVSGIGGTLAGNALSLAAARATLDHVLTAEAFERMIALAERLTAGVQDAIDRHGLPWHVTRLGCRAEYLFAAERPVTGEQAAAAGDMDLDRLMHLYMLNRGVLITPFHNMTLMCPATTEADVDAHTAAFHEAVAELVA